MTLNDHFIIASAARFEALPLLRVLESMGALTTYLEVGVGAIASAALSAKLRPLVTGRRVLFIGSCGWAKSLSKPYLIEADAATWCPSDVRQKRSYLVADAEPKLPFRSISGKSVLPQATVTCAGSIALVNEEEGETYENLELYSVAHAWLAHCRDFRAILGVTNQIGAKAHEEWKTNMPFVAQATAQFVKENANFLGFIP